MKNVIVNFAKEVVEQPVPYLENGRTRDGWDCWGLVVEAFKLVGVDLTPYEDISTKEVLKAYHEIRTQVGNWHKVTIHEAQPWDIVHLRPAHLGIVVRKGYMLHVMENIDTCVVCYKNPMWFSLIEGFYRHVGLGSPAS